MSQKTHDHGPAQLAPPGGLGAYLGDLFYFFRIHLSAPWGTWPYVALY